MTEALHRATAEIANWCAARPHDPSNYHVMAAYMAFKAEVLRQLVDLAATGVRFEATLADPYETSTDLFAACEGGAPWVFGKLPDDMPRDHPLAERLPAGLLLGRRHLHSFNTAFRAVHDWHGHYQPRNTFGETGEARAWLAHRAMFPRGIARKALVNETIAQSALAFRRRRMAGRWSGDMFAPQYAFIWEGDERALAKAIKAATERR